MRRIASALLPVLLLATACGSSKSSDVETPVGALADVTVSGASTEQPKIDFSAPLSFPSTQSKVVTEGAGDGDPIQPDSRVTIDYVGINASDGAEFDSSWKGGKPATFSLDGVIAGLSKGLQGDHAGDRVLITIASKDGFGELGNGSAIRKGDSLIFVVDVRKVDNPLAEATGTPDPAPPTVPKLTYDDNDHPEKFVATDKTTKSPSELGVFPIIKGDGATVKSGQTITVEYVGQLYPDGSVFDESWSNDQPVSFSIGTGAVIEGWDKGLVGQRVGSRVVLVIPSELGYGSAAQGSDIPADSDLIFVIDILQAS